MTVRKIEKAMNGWNMFRLRGKNEGKVLDRRSYGCEVDVLATIWNPVHLETCIFIRVRIILRETHFARGMIPLRTAYAARARIADPVNDGRRVRSANIVGT